MGYVQPLTAGESLGVGDEGDEVAELQRRLQHLGYYQGEVDERYGEDTALAVREFQRASGHDEDGRVGSETWEAVDREAQWAGYDPFAPDKQAAGDQGDSRSPSEEGETEWSVGDRHALEGEGDQRTSAATMKPGERSEDGQWQYSGNEWQAVDGVAGTEGLADTAPVDVSKYPDLTEGDTGEWVDYLDAMLRSRGF